ncbi:MAG TPA: polysaccharide deacetylase family protein [Actinomycetes bacterium]|nr:polysaccharide deacetylase family protein [Actinomycetes bacterium]
MPGQLLVFAWHNIERTWHYPAPPGAGARGFARQVATLKRMGTIVPLASALDTLAGGRPLPPRAIALTFDDGYADNLELAVPVLRRLEVPATFFLVPGILERRVRPWWEVLGWAFGRSGAGTLDWRGQGLPVQGEAGVRSMMRVAEQLKELDRAGRDAEVARLVELLEPAGSPEAVDRLFLDLDGARALAGHGFEVGSHSTHHAILSREPAADQQHDLAGSRRWLEAELDRPVPLLAYPNGRWADFDDATVAAARQAGHRHALTTQAGRNRPHTPPHALRRIVLEPHAGFAELAARRIRARLARELRRAVPPLASEPR